MFRSPFLRLCFLTLLLTGLGFSSLKAQFEISPRFQGTAGLAIRFGTHVNQVGITGNLAYLEDFVQINAAVRLTYNVTQLGPKPQIPGWELQSSLGAVVAYGPNYQAQTFLTPISSQLGRRYATAYAWTWYLDQRKTSQWTATIGQHISDFTLISENDAYTGFIDDRFRTGTFAVAYRYENMEFAWSTILWTGDARSKGVQKIKETDYPSRYGYKDLSEGQYGKFSHGLSFVQARILLAFNQTAQAQIGIDSEYVRHWLQNVLIHDLIFLPENLSGSKNPHYPMIDLEGEPFLFQKDQKVKPASFYLNLALNPSLFY
ncbi:MAG: polymorphic toxin type 23 domain-containing protein [Bacteroidota bacterium]